MQVWKAVLASGCGQPLFSRCQKPGEAFVWRSVRFEEALGLRLGLWGRNAQLSCLPPPFRTNCHLTQGELCQGASSCSCPFCKLVPFVRNPGSLICSRSPLARPGMPLIQSLGMRWISLFKGCLFIPLPSSHTELSKCSFERGLAPLLHAGIY